MKSSAAGFCTALKELFQLLFQMSGNHVTRVNTQRSRATRIVVHTYTEITSTSLGREDIEGEIQNKHRMKEKGFSEEMRGVSRERAQPKQTSYSKST